MSKDFWEEEHENDDENNETDDGGSDWKTEDELNPFEEFILDFLENITTKKLAPFSALKQISEICIIAEAVIERNWYSEQAETEAILAVFAMAYSFTIGVQPTATLVTKLSETIKKCVGNDIKAESERN
jgi:hypothetical protein